MKAGRERETSFRSTKPRILDRSGGGDTQALIKESNLLRTFVPIKVLYTIDIDIEHMSIKNSSLVATCNLPRYIQICMLYLELESKGGILRDGVEKNKSM